MLDRRRLAVRLAEMEAVYRSGRSPEELALLADIWAHDLADEKAADVECAMIAHRRHSTFFPTPADILRILATTRTCPDEAIPALPEAEPECDPRLPELLSRALRGDADARVELDMRRSRAAAATEKMQ